jgi:hypothetical protein
MGKATRYPELPAVLVGQLHCHMLAKGWAALAHIHRGIKHGTAQDSDQLALRIRVLDMQTA